MSKPKIYMAGKMGGLSYEEMNGWRIAVIKMFKDLYCENIHFENPVDYYNFEMDRSTYTDHEVKKFDLWLVKNCDLVLVNLDYPDSIGTAIEMHMAHDIWDIPVIGFTADLDKVHPWMKLSCTKICKTMEESVQHIIDFYLPNIV